MTIELARQRAARAWCYPETEHLDMIPELAEAFAKIIDEIQSKAYLGNATTRQLQQELKARERMGHLHPDYYTAMPDEDYAALGIESPRAMTLD